MEMSVAAIVRFATGSPLAAACALFVMSAHVPPLNDVDAFACTS
jgi:hypothetical protein